MKAREDKRVATWISQRMLFLYLAATVFTATQIGSGFTGAILPLYLLSIGVSLTTMGLLYSVLNLLSGLIRTPVGIISDTTGSRLFIFSGLFASIVAIACMALAWDWRLAAVGMVLTGLASGIFFPMMKRTAADETDIRDRVKAFMAIGLMFSVTGIVGPAIAGLIVEAYGLRSVFFVALTISLLGFLVCYRMPFASLGKRIERIDVGEIFRSARGLGRNAALLGVTNLLRTMTSGVSSALIPIYLQGRFNLTYGELGFYISLSGASALIGAPLASRFTTLGRRSRFIMLTQPILLPLYLCFVLVGSIQAAVISLMIINLLGGMTGPLIDTLISDIAPPDKIGSAYGVVDTFMRVGISVGNVIGGYAAEYLGFQAVFIISGLIALATSIPMLLFRRSVSQTYGSSKTESSLPTI